MWKLYHVEVVPCGMPMEVGDIYFNVLMHLLAQAKVILYDGCQEDVATF